MPSKLNAQQAAQRYPTLKPTAEVPRSGHLNPVGWTSYCGRYQIEKDRSDFVIKRRGKIVGYLLYSDILEVGISHVIKELKTHVASNWVSMTRKGSRYTFSYNHKTGTGREYITFTEFDLLMLTVDDLPTQFRLDSRWQHEKVYVSLAIRRQMNYLIWKMSAKDTSRNKAEYQKMPA